MINPEGYKIITLCFSVALFFHVLSGRFFKFLRNIFILMGTFLLYFFRDPDRQITRDENVLLSSADGKVFDIKDLEDGNTLLHIYMSPMDVHVNRAPCDGVIKEIEYRPGSFLPAYDKRAGEENESNLIVIDNGEYCVPVKQISGILARKIVCWVKEGQTVKQGEKIGMIKLGSGNHIIIPKEFECTLKKDDIVHAGLTIVARRANG